MTWTWLWIGAGGFVGAIGRYGIARYVSRRLASEFPYGTLFVNVLGSFLLGFLFGLGAPEQWIWIHDLFGIGLLGAFTTFSTYAAESLQLLRNRRISRFMIYQGVSYTAAIAVAALGWLLGDLLMS